MNFRSTLDWLKIALSLFYFGCLMDWDYSYYEFVRFSGLIGFTIIAVNEYHRGNRTLCIFWVAAAILVNPIFKISLGRQLWNAVDVVLGVFLLLSVFLPRKKIEAKENLF